jgi:hypothetical protein
MFKYKLQLLAYEYLGKCFIINSFLQEAMFLLIVTLNS